MRNWSDVLPPDVAEAQTWWEKARQVERFYDAGLSRDEALRRFPGVIPGRLIDDVVRNRGYSPVEKFMAQNELCDQMAADYYAAIQAARREDGTRYFRRLMVDSVERQRVVDNCASTLADIADRKANWHRGKRRKSA